MRSWIVVLALVACAVVAPAIASPRKSGPRLDETFGRDGVVVLRAPSATRFRRTVVPDWVAYDAVADREGRVWALYSGYGAAGSVLVAYDEEGRLDTDFGDDGVLALGVLGGFGQMALDSAGRIILLGAPARPPGPTNFADGREAVIVRVLPEGRLDPAFGFGGVQRHYIPGLSPSEIYADGADRVLVVEWSSTNFADPPPLQYVVFRLGPDGMLDRSYGDDGVAVVPRIGESVLSAHTVDTTGRFVAVDYDYRSGDRALVGLDASGHPDSALGEQGTRALDFGDRLEVVTDLAVDAAGKLVILGFSRFSLVPDTAPFIARYLPDGTPDATWSGTEDGIRNILADHSQWRADLRSLTIDGESYYAEGARFGPGDRRWGDILVVRVDADAEQVWTSGKWRFSQGFDQVLSARDGRVLAWSDLFGRRRPNRARVGLVRVRFD